MLRCIIAEDERILRKGLILTTDWKSLDCEVVGEAENGLEALDLFKTKKPDLLITDIRMPLMDGLELIEKCRPLHSADYIIMSGYSDFSYAKKAIHLGVSEYILKPLDEEELFDAITKIKRERLKKNASPPPVSPEREPGSIETMEAFICQVPSKNRYIMEAMSFLSQNYDREISLKEICKALLISESYLTKLFKEHVGYSFVDFLMHCRVRKACELLADPAIKIYAAAEQVGYRDQRYFSVIFKKITGMTPKEYQNMRLDFSLSHREKAHLA